MRKILLMGLVLVSCLFCINVNAEEKYLDFKYEQKDMVYFAEESITNISVNTNLEYISGEKLFYKIDDGEFIGIDPGTISIETDLLLNKAEHSITIYGETSEGKKTEEITRDFLMVNKEKSFESSEYNLKLNLVWVPINSTVEVEKVEDVNVLESIKLQDPFALKIRLKTAEEDMMYYFNKYIGSTQVYVKNIEVNASSFGIDNACLSSDSGTSHNEVKLYLVNNAYQILDTAISENCNLEYNMSFPTNNEANTLNVFLNGYVVFAKGELVLENDKDSEVVTPEVKDDTVESPKTGIEDYALFIFCGLALAVTSITIINRNKKFKRI